MAKTFDTNTWPNKLVNNNWPKHWPKQLAPKIGQNLWPTQMAKHMAQTNAVLLVNGVRCSKNGVHCSLFDICFVRNFQRPFPGPFVVRCSLFDLCFVRTLFCSHLDIALFCSLFLFGHSPSCPLFCSHGLCPLCSLCSYYTACELNILLAVRCSQVECFVRCSQVECFVCCSVNVERFVRLFAFMFGERFVVFAGLVFLTFVRCSVNCVRMRSW